MLNRREFIKLSTAAGVALAVPWHVSGRSALAQMPKLLNAAIHPKFFKALPIPPVKDMTKAGAKSDLEMVQEVVSLGLRKPNGQDLQTPVWTYNGNYPGATIVAHQDRPIHITWRNKLPNRHLLPVDTTVHRANPMRGIPTVSHLHGGHSEPGSDGDPEAWFTKNWRETGPRFVSRTNTYDNSQESGTLWYHDHALGITRLNVYAGLAGFYLLRDDNEMQMINDGVLPSGPYEIGLAIQDRMFQANGRLFMPTTDEELPAGAPAPSILAEFFGDFILVNGMAWPYLEVEPRRYRFRMLNGSDSRFYILKLSNNQPMLVLGTDGGFFDQPVSLTELLIMPGERADVVIDFSNLSGQDLILQNLGPDSPFKGPGIDPPADPNTTGQIMQFRVNLPLDTVVANASVDGATELRAAPIAPLTPTAPPRGVVLFEGQDEYGRLRPQLGVYDADPTLNLGSLAYTDPVTETPALHSTEVWEIYNTTEDAHPIHLHLVQFQVLNREDYTFTMEVDPAGDGTGGSKFRLTNPVLSGNPQAPEPNEAGNQDMVLALPGQVTRIIAHFDRPGRYVWHCHILSHEDHDMMRPFAVMDTGISAAAVDHSMEQSGSVLDKNVYVPIVAR